MKTDQALLPLSKRSNALVNDTLCSRCGIISFLSNARSLIGRTTVYLSIVILTFMTGCIGWVGGDGYYDGGVWVSGPDVYLFGGGYGRGHDDRGYGQRGAASRGAAHSNSGGHGRGGRR